MLDETVSLAEKKFNVHYAFDGSKENSDVYDAVGPHVLDGIFEKRTDVTVFSYG